MNEAQFPTAVYYRAYAGLVVLTVLTIVLAHVDLAAWNSAAALAIAAAKAAIVLAYFMHLRHNSGLCGVACCVGVVWVLILTGLVFADVLLR